MSRFRVKLNYTSSLIHIHRPRVLTFAFNAKASNVYMCVRANRTRTKGENIYIVTMHIYVPCTKPLTHSLYV